MNMKKKTIRMMIWGSALLALFLVAGCSKGESPATGMAVADIGEKATIFRGQSCGCCSIFTQYAAREGLDIADIVDDADLAAIKQKYNIPAQMQSCHTTIIGDYFVEGHVPIEAINKLMAEKPDIAGIALPGMQQGSPGMPGTKKGLFTIYAIGKDGSISEFMKV